MAPAPAPTSILRRVPRWAWLVAGGVGVGGLALRVIGSRRNADKAMESGTTGTDPDTGYPVGTAPPGVIVPPVITSGGGDSGEGAAALSNLAGVLGQGFSDVLNTAAGLAWTPGEIGTLVGQTTGAVTDQVTAVLAAAGGSPNPASQTPAPVNSTTPAPPPAPAPTPGPAPCPPAFPHRSTRGCYKNCGHTECGSNGRLRRNHGHCYQDGTRVHVNNEDLGKKC